MSVAGTHQHVLSHSDEVGGYPMFTTGQITGVVVKELTRHVDQRGWLLEVFRADEVEEQHMPVMTYVSMTRENFARGPHEHQRQTDYFCFAGPSNFKVYLWDNRKNSPTFLKRQVLFAGEDAPTVVIIPPGVVHAYKNVGGKPGMVVNCPNALYAGPGKKALVDELRYEGDPNTLFTLD